MFDKNSRLQGLVKYPGINVSYENALPFIVIDLSEPNLKIKTRLVFLYQMSKQTAVWWRKEHWKDTVFAIVDFVSLHIMLTAHRPLHNCSSLII